MVQGMPENLLSVGRNNRLPLFAPDLPVGRGSVHVYDVIGASRH